MTRSTSELARVFGRIGLQSFGGPAAQIALMHKELVEDRDWLSEEDFLRALSFCMLLPGPEAMQLATYSGWKQKGIWGGLIAGGLFVFPGAFVIMCLALAYGAYGTLEWVQTLFIGIQAAVVVIVIGALRKVAKKALAGSVPLIIAVLAFLALYVAKVPFPIVIILAAGAGAVFMSDNKSGVVPVSADLSRLPLVIIVGGTIWAAPLAIALVMDAPFLLEIGIFFSKLAVVTFGGAYAVLAYMAQAVVGDFAWLTAPQMLDALGLAETTPGPLILVTQFVAMVAGLAEGGVSTALLAGVMTLWVTFVPCFIWIFAGAPLIDWLSGQPRLQAALKGIAAAVVGVIANLSLWFAFHVFFGSVEPIYGVLLPVIGTVKWMPIVIAVLASLLLFGAKQNLFKVLIICAIAALCLTWGFGA